MADVSLFGWDQPMRPSKPKRGRAKGNAAPVGSGPAGETCGTCRHARYHETAKRYWKCALVKSTSGPGTDIRLKWPACSKWQGKGGGE